jgi:predicted HTH transcriptional regulator
VEGRLAKDASAFANADGGLLIYGVVEKGHIPVSVDAGVPAQERTREQIESVLLSTITPRIGVEIVQIPITPERSAFAVSVSRKPCPLRCRHPTRGSTSDSTFRPSQWRPTRSPISAAVPWHIHRKWFFGSR